MTDENVSKLVAPELLSDPSYTAVTMNEVKLRSGRGRHPAALDLDAIRRRIPDIARSGMSQDEKDRHDLMAAIERVWELHAPDEDGVCTGCWDDYSDMPVPYPCSVIH